MNRHERRKMKASMNKDDYIKMLEKDLAECRSLHNTQASVIKVLAEGGKVVLNERVPPGVYLTPEATQERVNQAYDTGIAQAWNVAMDLLQYQYDPLMQSIVEINSVMSYISGLVVALNKLPRNENMIEIITDATSRLTRQIEIADFQNREFAGRFGAESYVNLTSAIELKDAALKFITGEDKNGKNLLKLISRMPTPAKHVQLIQAIRARKPRGIELHTQFVVERIKQKVTQGKTVDQAALEASEELYEEQGLKLDPDTARTYYFRYRDQNGIKEGNS